MSAPSRVLLVAPSFHPAVRYGGPTSASWLLARALGAQGAEVRVLTTNAHGEETLEVPLGTEHERAPGVRVTYLPRRAWLGETAAPALLTELASRVRWAEVVHLGAVYSATTFPTLLSVRALGRPLAWTLYGAHYHAEQAAGGRRAHAKRVWDALARRLLEPASVALVAASELEAAASRVRMPDVRVEVVREPVELPPRPERAAREGPLRLLFLGRLHPLKGLERLLDALRGGASTLTVAGAGAPEYERSLRARAARLEGRVRLVGHVDERTRSAHLLSHDLLVVPSVRESYGIVVAEALAHGLPALVTRPSAWELLEREGAGLLVAPEGLARALAGLERARLAPMGARARAYAERELGVGRAVEKIRAIHAALARGRARPEIG